MVDAIVLRRNMVLMGQFFSGLCAVIVPYNRGGIGSNGYIWKYFLSINFFSFLSRHNIFCILLANFNATSFSAIFTLPSCSSIFCITFFLATIICCSSLALMPFFVVLTDVSVIKPRIFLMNGS